MNSAEALAQFEAQGTLQPGEEGWWKVWGANVHSVRKGDLVLSTSSVTGKVVADLVEDTFVSKSYPMRGGLIADGKEFTLGALTNIIVVRWGTHNTLA